MTQARDLADGKFDTNTLVVDAANNRVGIGTTSPALPFEVNGSTNVAVFRSDASNSIIQLANSTGTGGDNGTLVGSVGDHLYFRAGDSEKGRFLSSGGLTFNGDTAAANALDDYEEGTWTATAVASTDTDTGYYTKIGNRVFFQVYFQNFTTTGGASQVAQISGLPYSAAGDYATVTIAHNNYTSSDVENGYVLGTTITPIQEATVSGSYVAIGSGRYIMLTGHYRV